jgi:hypothetical protein
MSSKGLNHLIRVKDVVPPIWILKASCFADGGKNEPSETHDWLKLFVLLTRRYWRKYDV